VICGWTVGLALSGMLLLAAAAAAAAVGIEGESVSERCLDVFCLCWGALHGAERSILLRSVHLQMPQPLLVLLYGKLMCVAE
jgi:hypothetical protein